MSKGDIIRVNANNKKYIYHGRVGEVLTVSTCGTYAEVVLHKTNSSHVLPTYMLELFEF